MNTNADEIRISPDLLGIVGGLIDNAYRLLLVIPRYFLESFIRAAYNREGKTYGLTLTGDMREGIFDTIIKGIYLESYEQLINALEYVKRILLVWNSLQSEGLLYQRPPMPVPEGVKKYAMEFNKFISDPHKILTTYFTPEQRAELRDLPAKYLKLTPEQLANVRAKSEEVLKLAYADDKGKNLTSTVHGGPASASENMEGGARRRRRRRTHKNIKRRGRTQKRRRRI